MKVEDVIRAVESVRKGTAVVKITTFPKVLKKHRETGEPCPYTITKTTVYQAGLGWKYGGQNGLVNRARKSEGKSTDFESQGLKEGYSFWPGSETLIRREKDGQLYLRLYVLRGEKPESIWRDAETGKQFTAEQIKGELAGWLPKPSSSPGQGLDSPVLVRSVKVEGVDEVEVRPIASIINKFRSLLGGAVA